MNKTTLFSLPLIIALAACASSNGGGGGDGDGDDDPGDPGGIFDVDLPTGADLAALPTEGQDIINGFSTAAADGLADPRTSGSATYTGRTIVGIGDGADETFAVLLGDAELNADFDAMTVDGSFDNFEGYEADSTGNFVNDIGAVGGSVDITDGVISGSTYTGNVGGTLTNSGEDFDVDGELFGAFLGDGSVTAGAINGTLTNPDDTVDVLGGIFLLTED